MNTSALRRTARLNQPARVIDLAAYIEKLNPGSPVSESEFWSRYSAQTAILRVLNELRRERRALQRATRTLEHLASMRGEPANASLALAGNKSRLSRRIRVPRAIVRG